MGYVDPTNTDFARAIVSGTREAVTRIGEAPVVTERQAVVITVDKPAGICSVKIGGSSVEIPGIKFDPGYVPAVGDTCWVRLNNAKRISNARVVAKAQAVTFTSWP